MLRDGFIIIVLTFSLAACQKGTDSPGNVAKAAVNPVESQPILIASEDLLTVHNGALAAGTVITGSIQPERRAGRGSTTPRPMFAHAAARARHVWREKGLRRRGLRGMHRACVWQPGA